MSNKVQVWRRLTLLAALAAVLGGPIVGQAETAEALADSLAELAQPNVIEPSANEPPTVEARTDPAWECPAPSMERSLGLAVLAIPEPSPVASALAFHRDPLRPPSLARRLALFPSLLL
ncbi:MAG: hypothetical protein AB7I30_08620 [Isosphaeraceae bacterium]